MYNVKSVIDHIGVISKNIETSEDVFMPLGFVCGKRTTFSSGISTAKAFTNMHFVFDNGYIECIESKTDDDHLRMYLHSNCALHSMLVSSNDIQKSHKVALENGYNAGEVMNAARPADHGVKKGDAKFDWFKITNPETPYTMLGVVEHKTKDLMYQKERHVHLNTANRFTKIYVGAENEAESLELKDKFQKQYDTFIDSSDKDYIADEICIGTASEFKEKFGVDIDTKRSSYVGVAVLCESLDYVKNVAKEKGFKMSECENGVVFDFTEELSLFIVFEVE